MCAEPQSSVRRRPCCGRCWNDGVGSSVEIETVPKLVLELVAEAGLGTQTAKVGMAVGREVVMVVVMRCGETPW